MFLTVTTRATYVKSHQPEKRLENRQFVASHAALILGLGNKPLSIYRNGAVMNLNTENHIFNPTNKYL